MVFNLIPIKPIMHMIPMFVGYKPMIYPRGLAELCQGDSVEAFFASSGLNMAVKVGDKVRFMEDLGCDQGGSGGKKHANKWKKIQGKPWISANIQKC